MPISATASVSVHPSVPHRVGDVFGYADATVLVAAAPSGQGTGPYGSPPRSPGPASALVSTLRKTLGPVNGTEKLCTRAAALPLVHVVVGDRHDKQ